MKKIISIVVGLTLLLKASIFAYDNGDFQVWHTEVQEKQINKDSKITLEEEFRFGDNGGNLYYHHYDLGYVYAVNKNLDLGINYRQVYEKKGGDFKIENRPHINAIVKGDIKGFKVDDRNRLEYRHFDYQEDFWEYRNKFTVKSPWRFTSLEIQPYLADEGFIDLKDMEFTRNRFYSGFVFRFTKSLRGEIYYLFQHSKSSGQWINANVFGSKLKLLF